MVVESTANALQWLGALAVKSAVTSGAKSTALNTVICPGVGPIVGGILRAIGLGSLFS